MSVTSVCHPLVPLRVRRVRVEGNEVRCTVDPEIRSDLSWHLPQNEGGSKRATFSDTAQVEFWSPGRQPPPLPQGRQRARWIPKRLVRRCVQAVITPYLVHSRGIHWVIQLLILYTTINESISSFKFSS